MANKLQILTPVEFIRKNAEWWRDTPNEETYIMTPRGISYTPTNFMTVYTLNEIGDSNIPELNQYCISCEGQQSTINGENTSPHVQYLEDSFTIQRAYLSVILPFETAELIFKSFEKSDELMVSLEHCIDIDDNIRFMIKTNKAWKQESERSQGGRDSIWLTAVIDKDYNIKYPTRAHNKVGLFKQSSSHINNNYLQFNEYTFAETKGFGLITLITHKAGLDDDKNTLIQTSFKKKLKQCFNIEMATPQDKKHHISLPQMLTTRIKTIDLPKKN